MMFDRTMKMLLAAIALALWGLLLRPAFTTTPTLAQEGSGQPGSALVITGPDIYFHFNGNIFQFDRSLSLKARALRNLGGPENRPTYERLGP
jgi:hypothetical protein